MFVGGGDVTKQEKNEGKNSEAVSEGIGGVHFSPKSRISVRSMPVSEKDSNKENDYVPDISENQSNTLSPPPKR